MAGKVFQIAFEIGGKLAPGFGKSVLSASSNLDKLNKKVSGLGKVQGDISAFRKLKTGIGETKTSLAKAREEVRRLGAGMKATDKPTAAMSRRFGAAKKSVNILENKLHSQRTELKELSSELRKAGVSTRDFAKAQADLDAKIAKASGLSAKIRANQAARSANLAQREQYKSRMVGAVVAVGAVAAPVMVAANFEKAMNKVEAVSGATGESLDALRASARKMGAETQFSATQAAEAQNYLAMAGFDAEKIVASLPGVLNLAAAGDMDLARAADISSDVLTAFGGKAEDMGHLVDVFAAAASSANTDVSMLGESMKYAAAPAKAAGVSIEETTAILGLMANEGIKGSQAGTALRGALIRLAKQPKEAAGALDMLGVSAKDADGNMRSMETIMKDLSEATSEMGTADRNAALAKIFGTEALSGMLAVMKGASSGELADFTTALEKSDGAAAKMAKTMNKGAAGAMARLKSAMESVAIDAGNVLLPPFAAIVEGLAAFAGGISKVAQKHPVLTKAIVGVTTSLALLKVATIGVGYAWTFVKGGFLAAAGIFHNLRAAALLATGGQKALAAAQLEGTVAAKVAAKAQMLWGKAAGVFNAGKQAIAMGLLKAKTLALAAAQKVAAGAQWAFNAAMNANPIGLVIAGVAALVAAGVLLYKNWDLVSEKVTAAWGWIHARAAGVVEWFKGIPDSITKALSGIGDIIFGPFKGAFDKISGFLGKIRGLWQGVKETISGDPDVQRVSRKATRHRGAGMGPHRRFAEGGVATRPTLGIYGEAGKEYLIPVTSPNDDNGRRLWAAAGKDLGILPESAAAASSSGPSFFGKAFEMMANALDAWDLVQFGEKGFSFLGRQLGGVAAGAAAVSSSAGKPGISLGTIGALAAAGTLGYMSAGILPSGADQPADIPLSPDAAKPSTQPAEIHVTYSPTIQISSESGSRDMAAAIDKALRNDLEVFMAKLQQATNQERRLVLE